MITTRFEDILAQRRGDGSVIELHYDNGDVIKGFVTEFKIRNDKRPLIGFHNMSAMGNNNQEHQVELERLVKLVVIGGVGDPLTYTLK